MQDGMKKNCWTSWILLNENVKISGCEQGKSDLNDNSAIVGLPLLPQAQGQGYFHISFKVWAAFLGTMGWNDPA